MSDLVGNGRTNLAGNAAHKTVLSARVAARHHRTVIGIFKNVFHVTQVVVLSEDIPTLIASLARDDPGNYL